VTENWTEKLRKLNPNVSKAKGDGKARFAPHKALLLLCVIDLAEAGELDSPVMVKSEVSHHDLTPKHLKQALRKLRTAGLPV
jgi:hypothetical protein